MGQKLAKWAGRLSGVLGLTPVEQCVLLRMANAAYDYGVSSNGVDTSPAICKRSRGELAWEVYGDERKARHLYRPMAALRRKGLIEPVGPRAAIGHCQEYRLLIADAVNAHYSTFNGRYPYDAAELNRLSRASKLGHPPQIEQ